MTPIELLRQAFVDKKIVSVGDKLFKNARLVYLWASVVEQTQEPELQLHLECIDTLGRKRSKYISCEFFDDIQFESAEKRKRK